MTNGTLTPGSVIGPSIESTTATWEPPTVLDALNAAEMDAASGVPEVPGEQVLYNKDLLGKTFVFVSPANKVWIDEKTVANRTINAHDEMWMRVRVLSTHFDEDGTLLHGQTWDTPVEAHLGGAWLVPQIEGLSFLEYRTRPWTIFNDTRKENAPYRLKRPERESLGSAIAQKSEASGKHFSTIGQFEEAYSRLGFSHAQVCELLGVSSLYTVNWDQTYSLLERTANTAKEREKVSQGPTKKPTVHK